MSFPPSSRTNPPSGQNGAQMHGGASSPGIADLRTWRGSGCILIADDEVAVRAVMKQMLERVGFQVHAAADGREAVELYERLADQIQLVLLDVTMPHVSGEEVYRRMCQRRSDVRVILCSGYTEEEAMHRFAGSGVSGFLQKPFLLDTLIRKVRQVLAV